ncbi:MAG: phage head-tail joining protein [Hyphomicrobiaceae bacterium]
MAQVSYTQSELDALRRAFATGTLRVSYDGRTVEYGSADDLLKRIRTIEREMAADTPARPPVAGFAGFSRGDR